mgnify:CR=1 FL=1
MQTELSLIPADVTIPEESKRVFREALATLNEAGMPYVVGGAFAMHHYSGVWRYTNDLDLYLDRRHVPVAIEMLSSIGFRDFGEQAAGDREWIYHAMKDGTLMDLIWQSPNRVTSFDGSFFERGSEGAFLGIPVRFMAAEDLVMSKIFTLNHQRSDWPDVFQVIRGCGGRLDWRYVLGRLGDNWAVLLALIVLYDWVYPSETYKVPQFVRDDLLRRKLAHVPSRSEPVRESVLDPWMYSRPL